MNEIKLLEKTFKAGSAVLITAVLAFGGLFLNLASATASESPNMTVRMIANNDNDSPDAGWQHTLGTQAGNRVSFTVEVHNTVVGTEAQDVNVRVDLPTGVSNTHNIPVNVSTSNANSASDSVTLNVTSPVQGAELKFVPDSTRLYWDRDGDGTKEYNNTPLIDGIATSGLPLGSQKGCNDYIIQITFMAELIGGQVEPTPTPVTQTQSQSQSQTQNNNQTVNVTNNNTAGAAVVTTPAVVAAKAPAKTPETGVGILGMASMFGAAPLGVMLSRYGRGRLIGKPEEELSEVAGGLISKRAKRASA